MKKLYCSEAMPNEVLNSDVIKQSIKVLKTHVKGNCIELKLLYTDVEIHIFEQANCLIVFTKNIKLSRIETSETKQ